MTLTPTRLCGQLSIKSSVPTPLRGEKRQRHPSHLVIVLSAELLKQPEQEGTLALQSIDRHTDAGYQTCDVKLLEETIKQLKCMKDHSLKLPHGYENNTTFGAAVNELGTPSHPPLTPPALRPLSGSLFICIRFRGRQAKAPRTGFSRCWVSVRRAHAQRRRS